MPRLLRLFFLGPRLRSRQAGKASLGFRSRWLLLLSAVQLFGVSAFTAASAADLGVLQQSFMARYDEANAARDGNLQKLEASYLGALRRHLDKVKASGRLERVIPVRDEIQAIETGADPLPEFGENAGREMTQLREKYVEARERILKTHAGTLVDLATKMDEALKSAETDLTKSGKIEEALAAKRMRETLAEDAGLAAASKRMESAADSGQGGEWRFLLGEEIEVLKAGHWHVGILSAIPPEARPYARIVEQLQQRKERPETILMAPAPAKVAFKLKSKVTQLRGKCFLGNAGGSAAFKVWAGDTLVFEKKLAGELTDERFEIEFPPTRELILEVDPLGPDTHDWCSWIEPEIR